MNYIYDVLLNFSDEGLYEFYEWNNDDYLEYVKRMPLFKVHDKTFENIKNNDAVISKSFIDRIYEQSETYCDKLIKTIDYACLITNGREVIAIEMNSRGRVVMKSTMLLDEADEAIVMSEDLKPTSFNYEIIKKTKRNPYLTRNEERKTSLLNMEIANIYHEKKLDKLKYFYYECFNRINQNIDDIYKDLKKFIDSEWSSKHNALYQLIRLSYTKK